MNEETEHGEKTASQPSKNEPYSGSYSSPDGKFSFEICVGDDGLVYGIANGHEDEESAVCCRTLFIEVRDHLKEQYPLCFDISRLGEMQPKARRLWSNTALSKDSPFLRIAVHGGGFLMTSLINFYARIAHMPVRLFKTKEDAVAWLKEAKS